MVGPQKTPGLDPMVPIFDQKTMELWLFFKEEREKDTSWGPEIATLIILDLL